MTRAGKHQGGLGVSLIGQTCPLLHPRNSYGSEILSRYGQGSGLRFRARGQGSGSRSSGQVRDSMAVRVIRSGHQVNRSGLRGLRGQ